jgi:hypothetical protein
MTVAIVLALCCVAITAYGSWRYVRHVQRRLGETHTGAAAPPSLRIESARQPQPRRAQSMTNNAHRWSGRRPRLRLTVDGLRDTGQHVRFCLDCAAEKTEDQPSSEIKPK